MTQPNELELLKQKADLMGITYKSNIGVEALRAKVNAKLNDEPEPEDVDDAAQTQVKEKKLSKAEWEQNERTRQYKEHMALVRVRVTCMNPLKASWRGEIFTTGNKYLGTVRKMVPFGEGTENGYHIPKVLLQVIKDRKFNQVRTTKGKNGAMEVHQRLVPEFSIEVLEPLTQAELDKLAAHQRAAAGL